MIDNKLFRFLLLFFLVHIVFLLHSQGLIDYEVNTDKQYQQPINKIDNGSFIFSLSALNCQPFRQAQVSSLLFWKDEREPPSLSHSPDYFSTSGNHFHLQGLGGNSLNSGDGDCCYVGLKFNELIQQKFTFALDVNKEYILSFKVQTSVGAHQTLNDRPSGCFGDEITTGIFTADIPDGSFLNVILAASRIRYTSNESNEFDNSGDQNIEIVKRIPINYDKFSPFQWNDVEVIIGVPDVDWRYDWIGFELVNDQGALDGYLLVDDFSLIAPFEEDGFHCSNVTFLEDECSPTDGCIEPTISNLVHGESTPLTISGLENVNSFYLKIVSSIGFSERTIQFENPPPIVQFDGIMNNGATIPIGNAHHFNLILNNDEDYLNISSFFDAEEDPVGFDCQTMSYQAIDKSVIYEECCNECITFSNESLNFCSAPVGFGADWFWGQGHLSFLPNEIKAPGKIIIGPGIEVFAEANQNMTFLAQEEIIFLPDETSVTASAPNWEFVAKVEDLCEKSLNDGKKTKENLIVSVKKDELATNRNKSELNMHDRKKLGLIIYPNPADTQISISANSPIESLVIYDLSGRIIFRMQDINDLNLEIKKSQIGSGMFVVQVFFAEGTLAQKFIFN